MVYSTVRGHISVLNHHQIPSVSICSTHTENESQDITSICWNFLWTRPVYFALQIARSKTRSEEHNLLWFNLRSHHHSLPVSLCTRFIFAEAEMSLGTTVSTQPGIDSGPSTEPWESSGGGKLLKEDKWSPFLHLFTILSKPKDRSMTSTVPAHLWLVGHPHLHLVSIFVESAEVRAWFPREGKIFFLLLCSPAPLSTQLD